ESYSVLLMANGFDAFFHIALPTSSPHLFCSHASKNSHRYFHSRVVFHSSSRTFIALVIPFNTVLERNVQGVIMAEEMDKSHDATPFKLMEARKKGQVAKSLELVSF